MPIYLLLLTELRTLQAAGGVVLPGLPLLPFGVSFGPLLQQYRLPLEAHFPVAKPCTPMPLVTRVSQTAAYEVCSHPASESPVDDVLYGHALM